MKGYGTPSAPVDAARPLAALIGRPNVGKSSLFNRMVGGRPALVEDMPGVTRDRRYGVVDWMDGRFRVVDTGGLDPSASGILGAMRAQTLKAVAEADVLVFVVDAVEGLTAVDREVATLLRRANKPVLLAANKVDSDKREAMLGELYGLGFDKLFAISASHGRGIGDLLDALVTELGPAARAPREEGDEPRSRTSGGGMRARARAKRAAAVDRDRDVGGGPAGVVASVDPDEGPGSTSAHEPVEREGANGAAQDPLADRLGDRPGGAPEAGAPEAPDAPVRIAFVGKANAGKSSLVNRLLGEERVLVHDEPGTTRDPIDTPFVADGQSYVLVDTAGIRRRRTVETLTDAVAAKMTRDQLARADVAVLVIDAGAGPTTEDAKIAGLIEDAGRAAILVLNKKDMVRRADTDAMLEATKETFPFLSWAPILWASARTGAGVLEIVHAASRVFAQTRRRIPTGELNRFLETIVADRPPPSGSTGRHVRLYFATQAGVKPPTIVISASNPDDVPPSYRRFLVNQLRRAYGFEGTPLRIVLRPHRRKTIPRQAPVRVKRG